MASPSTSLDHRYVIERGTTYLTGVQALVRLPLDQHRRDVRAGLRTGSFICGYPGSPLGNYDLALQRIQPLLDEHEVIQVSGANEELAATSITGTQMLDEHPHSRYDGVIGIWYGKGPGVDRSGDAFKHGNFAGTSRHGAVVVLSADDHEGKSSTMPFQDDFAFVSAGIPVLYPSSVTEFLEFGLHAIALSRFSGCWVAMKLVGQLCDGGEMVTVDPETPSIVLPAVEIDGKPFRKRTDFVFFPGKNVEFEHHLYYERHTAVRAYARANQLDRVRLSTADDRIGIITAGKSYADVRQALLDFGLTEADLRRLGVRLMQVGLIYPLDGQAVREFASGLEELIVVEEKRGFLESQVKEALYGLTNAPRLLGKLNESGTPLFPFQGGMDSDTVAERLGPRLLALAVPSPGGSSLPATDYRLPATGVFDGIHRRLEEIAAVQARTYDLHPLRTPNYCSGCPHNTSTRLLEGQIAWGSPGCHSFATIMEQPSRHIEAMTQYGGEGLPWVGLSHFTDRPHMIQNVGDGSLFHSSYLNIRFCVATGVNITFKILYNGSIANTGAQAPVGIKNVPDLTRMLELEGVSRIAVVTKSPESYHDRQMASNAQVFSRDDYEIALRQLTQERGVTVLIYDEMCANERRRRRKRGKLAPAQKFVLINQEVCEGCGDCGAVSNCMSLQRVDTEFGQKTQIHQSSCNQDYFCLKGDCPSFVTIEADGEAQVVKPTFEALDGTRIPEPGAKATSAEPYRIYIPGAGGTGVLTLNALLSYAALLDGKHVLSYDQTGAAQKWGPVLSSLVIADEPEPLGANKVGLGKANLYLATDIVGAVTPVNLDRCDPERTASVVNTTVFPNGEMIRNVDFTISSRPMQASLRRFTDPKRTIFVEARVLSEKLFGDYMMTNIVTLGVAYQSGLVPLTAESIEAAIRLNGVQAEANIQGFRYGRLFVHDPAAVQQLIQPPSPDATQEREKAADRLPGRQRAAYERLLDQCVELDEESRRLLAIRLEELIDYQDVHYPEGYLDFVLATAERERQALGHSGEVTHTVIKYLYKLMAYKDEYEVARLHLKPAFQQEARSLLTKSGRVQYHLHPPFLRAVGMKHKLTLGTWFHPGFAVLRGLRRIRGTWLDVFGRAEVRRTERELIAWYRDLAERALTSLTPESLPQVLQLLSLPDRIRGYEQIKMANVRRVKAEAERLSASLTNNREATPVVLA